MITLGLDPSLTGFGWCVHDSNATGPARIVAKGQFKTKASDIFVTRYISLRDNITKLFKEYPQIEAVGVESPPFGALWSEGLYGLFLYVNEAIFEARKDVVFFDPQTVKMLTKIDHRARKGKMFKSDMVAAAKADTGIKGRFNHNEADAYHIARFAARFWGFVEGDIQEDELTPAEHQSFVNLHVYKRGARAGQEVRKGVAFKENSRFFRFSQLPMETA